MPRMRSTHLPKNGIFFEIILGDECDLMIFYDIQKSQNIRVGLMISDENDRTVLREVFLVDDTDINLHAFDDMV